MRIFLLAVTMLFTLGCAQHMLLQKMTGDVLQCVSTRGERAASWWKTRESAYKKCVQLAKESGYEEAAPSDLAQCMKQAQEDDKYLSPRSARKSCLQQADYD